MNEKKKRDEMPFGRLIFFRIMNSRVPNERIKRESRSYWDLKHKKKRGYGEIGRRYGLN